MRKTSNYVIAKRRDDGQLDVIYGTNSHSGPGAWKLFSEQWHDDIHALTAKKRFNKAGYRAIRVKFVEPTT